MVKLLDTVVGLERSTSWVSVKNPGNSAMTAYLPSGNESKAYIPCSSVTVLLEMRVPTFVKVIFVPGMTAVEVSLTTPRTVATGTAAALPDQGLFADADDAPPADQPAQLLREAQ